MNKIVASLGIAALGASSIPAAYADDLGSTAPKIWSISASLRGFYDDNINGAPDGPGKIGSLGFEVSPSATLNWKADQTTVDLDYIYSFRYFEKERFVDQGHDSQSHLFRGTVDHSFSERYSVTAADWFTIGQEPDLLRNPLFGVSLTPTPVPGNNIHNYGLVKFNGQLTPLFGFEAGYDNSYFNYEDSGFSLANGPSFSGLFDRIEQTAHINANWLVTRQTTAFVGYQFGWINYTADERIAFFGPFRFSGDKDNDSHYIYAGVQHYFLPSFYASLTAGARIINFVNVSGQDDSSPYVRALVNYTYCPESTLQAGFSYDLSMTGVADAQASQTEVFFVNVHHRIVPKFYANLNGQIQNSTINSGVLKDDNSLYYTVGLNLEYQITRYFSANVGYDFDKVNSDPAISNDYVRNRVYFGITASY
jgi:Putative beta-barrel porin 2